MKVMDGLEKTDGSGMIAFHVSRLHPAQTAAGG